MGEGKRGEGAESQVYEERRGEKRGARMRQRRSGGEDLCVFARVCVSGVRRQWL